MSDDWREKVEQYCDKYNIPVSYLAETLYEPKVVPMIRGKGFEFSVMMVLQETLPRNEWRVSKATMLEETSFHDTDIRVFHKRTGRVVRVECKLAKKEGYKVYADGHSEIRVKCMRSRTLGAAKVKELAPKLGVTEQALSIHNDQYLTADFDVVVTSIGNAFYRTDKETGYFEWRPKEAEEKFLLELGCSDDEGLKDLTFQRMYVARTQDIAATAGSGVVCTRKACTNKSNCGFVPNYPIIRFDAGKTKPVNAWVPIDECPNLFKGFVTS